MPCSRLAVATALRRADAAPSRRDAPRWRVRAPDVASPQARWGRRRHDCDISLGTPTVMPKPDATTTRRLVDPRNAYPRPPFRRQRRSQTGDVDDIDPRPDHGEDSYVGSGQLEGVRALITGSD